jgi:hypothetical protein
VILRRLAQNLREQNWTAIAIEFVLLVVGVYLGIQAQQWQSELEGRRLEQDYLQRMLNDVDLSIQTNELNITRLEGLAAGQALVVYSLGRCELPEAQRDAFADGLSDLAKVGPSVFVLSTVDEMLSAGKFSLARNPAVRDAMNGLARDARYQDNIFTAIHAQLAASSTTTSQRFIRTYPDYRTPFDPVRWNDLSIDFEGLCQDRAFQAAVSNIRYLTEAQISLNQRANDSLHKAKAVLEVELGLATARQGATP